MKEYVKKLWIFYFFTTDLPTYFHWINFWKYILVMPIKQVSWILWKSPGLLHSHSMWNSYIPMPGKLRGKCYYACFVVLLYYYLFITYIICYIRTVTFSICNTLMCRCVFVQSNCKYYNQLTSLRMELKFFSKRFSYSDIMSFRFT